MSDSEIILAQEQDVLNKVSFERSLEGTLIFTNKRLIFVGANREEDIGATSIRFADINDLASLPPKDSSLSIPLDQVEVEKAGGGIISHPSLRVKWREGSTERKAEFVQELIDRGRKKNLGDWARVIEGVRSGSLKIQLPSSTPPGKDSLGGRILYILGDMQEKGVMEIEELVEGAFEVDLDPDQVEDACKSLVSQGFLDASEDAGTNFYRKRSPLGEDDLSS